MKIPKYFEFQNSTKILCGYKALENIPYELNNLNSKRPLIVTDSILNKLGLVKIVVDAMKDSNIIVGSIYDKVPPDSDIKVIEDLAKAYKEFSCDSFIAIGGGSVIDTCKGANVLLKNGNNDLVKVMGSENITIKLEPFIVIPTTSGTGSEVTCVAVVKDHERHVKMAFQSYHLLPDVAVLDPRMTKTLPKKITATTGCDALTHAIESYYCLQKNPISDIYAGIAMRLIVENLPKCINNPQNEDFRLALALASNIAGASFSNSMVGSVHQIGHALGGVAGVPHGAAMAILLPHVMQFNYDISKETFADMLQYLINPEELGIVPKEERAQRAIDVIKEFISNIKEISGIATTLQEAGVDKQQLDKISKTALNDGAGLINPILLSETDILSILQAAL